MVQREDGSPAQASQECNTESSEFSRRLDKQSKHLQRGQRLEELERLLGGMELEAESCQGGGGGGGQEKKAQELAVLKEKIHHLDDMLKSQQRKVCHMIEQLQNSRTVTQKRDQVIRDPEVFWKLRTQRCVTRWSTSWRVRSPPLCPPKNVNPKPIVYSKLIKPSTMQGNKSLPLISH
ncbi:uncharacterized protein ACWYII_024657 [Salvelinus alpinus]